MLALLLLKLSLAHWSADRGALAAAKALSMCAGVGGSWEMDKERTFIEETRMIPDFKYAQPLKTKGNSSLSSSHFYQLI